MSPAGRPPAQGSLTAPRLAAADAARIVERLEKRLPSLDTDELRARAAAGELACLRPADVVTVLGQLQRRARDVSAARYALAAVSRALAFGFVDPDHLASCLSAARSAADRLVEALLAAGPAARTYAVEDEQFVDRKLRALSLGERRALSRTRDPDWLARLAHDPDPRVIRELLRNPRSTEREAILVASRRPQHAEVLEEVVASRFGPRPRVRLALAQNPYSPVSVAARAMSTLPTQDLDSIAANEHLPEETRRHARTLRLGRRTRPAERAAAPVTTFASDPDLARVLAELDDPAVAQLELVSEDF